MTFMEGRWENGSFFHLLSDKEGSKDRSPWDENGVIFGSGRDAFRSLIQLGQDKRGWKRLWVPSYFCQEVVKSLLTTGIQVRLYADGPLDNLTVSGDIPARPGDVVLRMNYFGLRSSLRVASLDRSVAEVIDDHSHDPWSVSAWQSDADWCIASLRKTLPIPDGGVLWSPLKHEVPPLPPVTPEHNYACLSKFAAMTLKTLYLGGYPVEKSLYRELAGSGEEGIASGNISGMPDWVKTLLNGFPISMWREKRNRNHLLLGIGLQDIPFLQVLQPDDDTKTCPFAGIVLFNSPKQRDHVRQQLVRNDVYPTILWPLDNPAVDDIPSRHLAFSQKMFTIHCDMRYGEDDMKKVAGLIRKSCSNCDYQMDLKTNSFAEGSSVR